MKPVKSVCDRCAKVLAKKANAFSRDTIPGRHVVPGVYVMEYSICPNMYALSTGENAEEVPEYCPNRFEHAVAHGRTTHAE